VLACSSTVTCDYLQVQQGLQTPAQAGGVPAGLAYRRDQGLTFSPKMSASYGSDWDYGAMSGSGRFLVRARPGGCTVMAVVLSSPPLTPRLLPYHTPPHALGRVQRP
jgi:hypothetical protein